MTKDVLLSMLPKKYQDQINGQLKKLKSNPKASSKYRSCPVKIDGYRFDSKKEAKRYRELKLAEATGEAVLVIRQPQIDLGAGVVYKADFLVIWKDGTYTIEDPKGVKTPMSKLKKKLAEGKYPIKILWF